MRISSARSIEPLEVSADVFFEEQDLTNAFASQNDPDEDLFFELYGPPWRTATVSKKLYTLARVAELAEGATAQSLNPKAGTPEPKEKK